MFGKVVIFGASRGIGYDLSLQIAPICESLILCSRNSEVLATLATRCKHIHSALKVSVVSMDLSEVSAVRAWFFRHTDAERVVYCAGISQRGVSYNTSDAVEDYIFSLNYRTPKVLAKEYYRASPRISREPINRQFCYISSLAAHNAVPLRSSYCASKAATELYLRTMEIEAKREELRVSMLRVIVGSARTDISLHALTETMQTWGVQDNLQKSGMPSSKVAKKICKAIRNNKRSTIYLAFTIRLWIFYCLGRIAPRLTDRLVRSANTTK